MKIGPEALSRENGTGSTANRVKWNSHGYVELGRGAGMEEKRSLCNLATLVGKKKMRQD